MQRSVEDPPPPAAVVEDEEDGSAQGERWAWRRRLREKPHTRITLRVVVGLLGTLLILAGAVTGPLPGPGGIPLVLLGLAVWSSEFRWAHRLMQRFKRLVRRVAAWPRRWKVAGVLTAVVIGWSFLYASLWYNGIPGWLPGWLVDALDALPRITPEGHGG